MGHTIRAAAVQAEPEWLDLEASIAKTCKLIAQAASQGAKIVALPEAFVPGYPAWIWYAYKLLALLRPDLIVSAGTAPWILI